MCAWSVVNTMFPVSASAGADEHEASPVLFTSLSMVFLILSVLIFGLWMIPSFLWKTLFGAQFEMAATGKLAPLLISMPSPGNLFAEFGDYYRTKCRARSRTPVGCSWLSSGALRWGLSAAQHAARSNRGAAGPDDILLFVLHDSFITASTDPESSGTYSSLSLRRLLTEEE